MMQVITSFFLTGTFEFACFWYALKSDANKDGGRSWSF